MKKSEFYFIAFFLNLILIKVTQSIDWFDRAILIAMAIMFLISSFKEYKEV